MIIDTEYYITDNVYNSSLIYGECDKNDIYNIFQSLVKKYNIFSFIDIGSGCGKLVFHLSQKFDKISFHGVEIQKNRFNKSMKTLQNDLFYNVSFFNDEFKNIYFGNYDFLFCCNTIFSHEDNLLLYKKIINEFSGIFVLFTLSSKIQRYYVEKKYIKTSWHPNVPVYIYNNF